MCATLTFYSLVRSLVSKRCMCFPLERGVVVGPGGVEGSVEGDGGRLSIGLLACVLTDFKLTASERKSKYRSDTHNRYQSDRFVIRSSSYMSQPRTRTSTVVWGLTHPRFFRVRRVGLNESSPPRPHFLQYLSLRLGTVQRYLGTI